MPCQHKSKTTFCTHFVNVPLKSLILHQSLVVFYKKNKLLRNFKRISIWIFVKVLAVKNLESQHNASVVQCVLQHILKRNPPYKARKYKSPIFLRIQIQLMQLLVGLLVGQLLPSFYIVWYDLPTNYSTNNRISWIWMGKKIRLLYFLAL